MKTNKLHEWLKNNYSQPDILIEPIYKLFVPWLIFRSNMISNHLSGKKTEFTEINKFALEGVLPEKLQTILSCSYKELLKSNEKTTECEFSRITLIEKMIWLFIRECQYLDTIAFNLPESEKVMEHVIELFEEYQDVRGVAENIDEPFEGIQKKYFSY